MRLRLLIVFLLIVIIPMIALGWFSVKSARDQREIHKHRIIALITQNLASFDEGITELVKSYERKLNELDSVQNYSVSSLRKLVRSIPAVHQLLILDKRGKRIFPSRFSFTQPERDFILRSKPFIETFLKDDSREKGKKINFRVRKDQPRNTSTHIKNKRKNVERSKSGKNTKAVSGSVTKKRYGSIRIEQHLYANTRSRRTAEKKLAEWQAAKNSSRSDSQRAKRRRQNYLTLNHTAKVRNRSADKRVSNRSNKDSTVAYKKRPKVTASQPLKVARRASTMPAKPAPYGIASDPEFDTKKTPKNYRKPRTPGQIQIVQRNKKNVTRRGNTTKTKQSNREGNASASGILNRKQKILIAQEERKGSSTSSSPLILGKTNKKLALIKSSRSLSSGLPRPSRQATTIQKKESVFQDLRGWSIGFRKNGINLIYSYRKSDGYLIAAEISRTRLIADIILLLPTSKTQNKNATQSLITLTNARGDIVYQWGNHRPAKKNKPLVSYSLAVPLNTWRLNYFSPKIDINSTFSYAPFALGLSTVFFAVFGLAFYFYRESNRELTVASQRVTFVNQVSHELKTPLTNIRMYAELLEDDLEDTSDKTRYRMQVIVNESQRLSRMIINVLNFARHQRKQLTVIRSLRVVDDVIRHVLDQVKPALERQKIEVEFKANANEEINIDADILEQILHNLISNVEKYAAGGHYLGIESKLFKGFIEITLSDKGPGIPRHMVHKIFEAFYRGENKLSEGVSGTGIGLSISRELARLHGGDLELVNNRQGITFKLTLDSKAN